MVDEKQEIELILNEIKEQTRKLAAGCSKHYFEVVDRTDGVSVIYLRQGEADMV